MRTAAGALLTALALASCTPPAAYPPVPPPRAEVLPNPPVSQQQLIWRPGAWAWTGGGYVWQPGDYVAAGGHGNRWMPGYWTIRHKDWVWIPAHWL